MPKEADGQVSSVARRFALIATAGELGTAFGVLPWPKGEAIRAAQACFRSWLKARGGAGAGEDTAAISVVRQFIELHGESRFTTIFANADPEADDNEVADGRGTINRVGFRRKGDNGWQYLILPEVWKNEVCKGLDHVRAANVLKDAGLLMPGDGRHLMRRVTIAGYGRPRLYSIKGEILGGSSDE